MRPTPPLPLLCALALAVSPQALSSALRVQQAGGQQEAGDAPTVEEVIDEVAELLREGARVLAAGDTAAAIERFESAAQRAPDLPEVWLVLAQARDRAGLAFEALDAARTAHRLAPDNLAAEKLVARQLARLGAVDEALSTFESVRRRVPADLDATLIPALLLRDTGRTEAAIELLETGRRAGIDSPLLLRELALIYLGEGRTEEALAAIQPLAQAHTDLLALPMGLTLAATPGRREEALPWLETAFEAGGRRDPRLALELGSLLLEAGRTAEGTTLLERAVELDPDSAQAHYRLGTALRQQGDLERSRLELERFQELSRADDDADWDDRKIGTELNEAQNLAMAGDPAAALARIDEILARRPADHRALSLRAKILYSTGELDPAVAAITTAAHAAPDRVEYHYLEGLFLLDAERPADAELALRRALALDDGLAEAHQLLGIALAQQGRLEESLSHFEAVLALGADNPQLRLAWAAALEALGRDAEAQLQREALRELEER